MKNPDVSMKDLFEGMTDSERSAELLKRRESLWDWFRKEHPEISVSIINFKIGKLAPLLAFTVQIHTEEDRQWILENLPVWEELRVVPYTPDDLHEITLIKYHARLIVGLLQSDLIENRLLGITQLEEWIGDKPC